jgi:hypothetical protein
MGKKTYKSSSSKKTTQRMTSKDTGDIFRKEFVDSHGNKVIINVDFAPHSIREPMFKWTREYGDK